MKIDKHTITTVVILSIFIVYCIIGSIWKHHAAKKYAIGYVINKEYIRTSYTGTYRFKINNKYYEGTMGKGKVRLHKYFIVEYVIYSPKYSDIKIEIPINPNALVPQPPEGWSECPINEDGSIKEKYRRKNKDGNYIEPKNEVKKTKDNNDVHLTPEEIDWVLNKMGKE